LLLLSPVISLFVSRPLTNHAYYRLFYHVIADKETAGAGKAEEKVLRLFQYVIDHEYAQGAPYEYKPLESLIYGEAYCDFQARTLNALLGVAAIPSRYAMLLDKDGVSPHTLNEIYLNGKWCIFDTTTNIIFKDDKASHFSLQELSDHPDLIGNQKKMIALKRYEPATYWHLCSWFSRMFPMPAALQRSVPTISQAHILDRIGDGYFKLFKRRFFNAYQDLYLKFKVRYSGQNDFRLFFMARNYHLAYRQGLALKYYRALLEKYPQTKFREDAIFFLGMLYFEGGDFSKMIELYSREHPAKWRNAVYGYLGKAHNLIGNKQASIEAYRKSDIFRLPTEILEELAIYGRRQ